MIAVERGHLGIVEVLLAVGADPGGRTSPGQTPRRWRRLRRTLPGAAER
jgi:hypothetical protein